MANEKGTAAAGGKIWSPVFIKLFVVNFLIHVVVYAVNNLSGVYANFLGAPASVVGMISSIFALTALAFKLVSGPANDSFSRKKILLFSIAVLLVSMIFYTLSNNIPMLFISRLLTGAGLSFSTTVCLAIASDVLPVDRMNTGIGYYALGTAVCQAIAPTIGLKMVDWFGWKVFFLVGAVVMVLTFLYVMTMKLDDTPSGKFHFSFASIIAKEALLPALLLFLLNFAYSTINAFLVIYAGTQNVGSNIGLFFTVFAVTMIFTRPWIGTMADKHGPVLVLSISMVIYAVSFLLISVSKSLPMFLIAAFLFAFGYGGSMPSFQALAMKAVPSARRGAASSTVYIGNDAGQLVGPIVCGAIVEASGYVTMWRTLLIPIAITFAILLIGRTYISNLGKDVKNDMEGENDAKV